MTFVRLLFVLFLSFAVDGPGPLVGEPFAEAEEAKEVAHRSRQRSVRPEQAPAPRAPVHVAPAVERHRLIARTAPRRRAAEHRIRKAPSLIAEPSAAPEDH